MPRANINKKRKKVKGRFYVILAVAAGLVALIWYIIANRGEGTVTSGAVALDISADAVVIRDETTVTVEEYDRVTFLIDEGAAVTEGVPVAQVYKWGYSDDMMTSLITLESNIYDKQQELVEDVEMPELDALEQRIEDKQSAIRSAVLMDSGADLLQLENELDDLLLERMEYLRTNVQPSTELNDLYAQLEARETQLAAWKSEIAAKGAGLISFYFDGYESVLSASKIDMLSAEMISAAVKGGGAAASTSEDRLYRLVNGNHWYIAFVTKASDVERVAVGAVYTVIFEDYTDTPYTGVALEPIVSGDSVVNVLEFTGSIGGFLSVRSVGAEITASASGAMVPVKDIAVKDGVTYVEILAGSTSYMMEVKILATDGDNAVVAPVNPLDSLTEGMRYRKVK